MKSTIRLFVALYLGGILSFGANSQTIGTPDEKAEYLTAIMTDEIPMRYPAAS
jgi:hypothetical protein